MNDGPWITEEMECQFCGHEWVSVHPACERIECAACGRMTKTHFVDVLLRQADGG